MLFSSITFLYYFLPYTLLIYFLAPKNWKNVVLFIASLFFYAWGEPKYILLMLLSIFVGFIFGLLIERYHEKKQSKYLLSASILICGGFLIYFKYADFLVMNLNLVGFNFNPVKVALPIGISFYTFQIISYLIDVYRCEVKAQRNFLDLAAYVAMFPQLIAGPIVRYSDIEAQLAQRTHSLKNSALGIQRFTIGLTKKILLANGLAELCSVFRATSDPSVIYYWMYAVAFTLHIYFDFSGYSDMAIGLGKILGFHFPENFQYPYLSTSITEFWRRWHMSLGSWFRDYVYIPLGGNRVSRGRWLFNIAIVWMLTGLWHGASWNFVLWGIGFGIILMIEKLWLLKYLKEFRLLNHLYVMFIVILSFVLFNAADLHEAFSDIINMFGMGSIPLVSKEALYYLSSYSMLFLIAMIACTPLLKNIVLHIKKSIWGVNIINIIEPFAIAVMLLIVTAYLVDGSFNPFIYFRF